MSRAPIRGSRASRGVSLVEAMVALAVMAFGLLGVVGLQATLRSNADLSRQRNEAVRIAEAKIEAQRAYLAVEASAGADYADIATITGETTTSTNAEYLLSQTVAATPTGRAKSVVVRVSWRDRTTSGDDKKPMVAFGTVIAGVPPELAGSLALPRDATLMARPAFRHPAIPVQAVANENGTSELRVPGVARSLVFDNLTARIVESCETVPTLPVPTRTCTTVDALLLSGYVRFATGLGRAPRLEDAAAPVGDSKAHPQDSSGGSATATRYVSVQRDAEPRPEPDLCLWELIDPGDGSGKYLGYYCAVPVAAATRSWSGTSMVEPQGGVEIASNADDTTAARVRICRYAPSRNPTRNADHPAKYSNVSRPLTNQNFLVIDAGDGSVHYDCPKPDGEEPFTVPATWPHQPPPP